MTRNSSPGQKQNSISEIPPKLGLQTIDFNNNFTFDVVWFISMDASDKLSFHLVTLVLVNYGRPHTIVDPSKLSTI